MVPNFILKMKKCSQFTHESPTGSSPSQKPNYTSNAMPTPVVHHNCTLLYFNSFSEIKEFYSIHNIVKLWKMPFEDVSTWGRLQYLATTPVWASELLFAPYKEHIQLPLTEYWADASSARQLSALFPPNTYLPPCRPTSCPGLPFAQCCFGCWCP